MTTAAAANPIQVYPKKSNPAAAISRKPEREYSVYVQNMITMKIPLKMNEIGTMTKQNLERKIVERTEGKCIPEGFIRPDSVHIISYSSGLVDRETITFQVVFDCLVCNPPEGMTVECVTRTITKAGIHAEVVTDKKGYIPLKIFVARDHNYTNKLFSRVKENMKIKVKIIGKRFEFNDPHIVAIASLVDLGNEKPIPTNANKPKIHVLPINANDNIGLDVDLEEEQDAEDEE
jgi:DNA-directed RNA polymerase subunit E'/Rpb7